MSQFMNRTPNPPGASVWDTPDSNPVQFFEDRYNSPGPQEWIFAPDSGPWYVTLYFVVSGGGAAYLEGSDEAPSDILSSNISPPASVKLAALYGNEHRYPLTETVIDTVRVKVEGATAVRVNVVGGTVDLTARC
jgi:hypothetical protein